MAETDASPPGSEAPQPSLSMTVLMTPDMSNFAGNVHGGLLLKYLDQVAYTCATRYARNYAVTLSVDQVVFRDPSTSGNWSPSRHRSTSPAARRWRSGFG